MRTGPATAGALLVILALLLAPVSSGAALDPWVEIPAGTRFLVELRTKLEAKKIKPGKKFEARTLEALQADDGSFLPAGAKLKGRVTYAKHNELVLRFERFYVPGDKVPVVASVVGVLGEKNVKEKAGREGEIKAEGGRGKSAAIGAVVGGGVGAAVGAAKDGAKGAAIGAGIGAGAGALIGAAAGGRDLVLHKGTRLELELDRPLVFGPRN